MIAQRRRLSLGISQRSKTDRYRTSSVLSACPKQWTYEGNVEWSGLQFAGPPAFDVPDASVKAGEAIALTGPSGSGKSTLIAALGGIATPIAGTVKVDGAALGPETIRELRNAMAWMPQQPHFFAGTLSENLMLGASPSHSIDAALKLASAEQIIDRLPNGLETMLSENGAGVSGGEARRLMLAQAALRPARIILADEPTADLDDQTAGQVIDSLLQLHDNGRTLIVATHDPRLIASMDREIKL